MTTNSRIYLETDIPVGSDEYYELAMDLGYYGVENKTGKAFK